MKRLLVVYDNPQGKKIDYDKHIALMKTGLGKDYKVGRTALINLEFWVRKNKFKVKTAKDLDLKKIDAVFFARWQLFQNALATSIYLQRHNIPFKSRQVADFPPTNKLGETALLSDNILLLPDTVTTSVANLREKAEIYLKSFKLPVVLKHIESSFGNDNYLVRSAAELRGRIESYEDRDIFMIQEFIPNDCDYRCLIFNGKLDVVIKRTRLSEDTHLNNTNKGANSEIVIPVPAQLKKPAERAARLTGRRDFAGVDIVIHKETQQPYVLEVNKMPRLYSAKVEKATAVTSFLRSI